MRLGNHSRFMNHSDKPNCYQCVMISDLEHKIAFFAARDIPRGEELTIDYGYEEEDRLHLLGLQPMGE